MGGATFDDAVRRLMQAVLSFAVGSELNWVGHGQKRSFRNTRLQGVLFCKYRNGCGSPRSDREGVVNGITNHLLSSCVQRN
ncbi:unnamed protein product, partial [Coregonus sp. 'balchen']